MLVPSLISGRGRGSCFRHSSCDNGIGRHRPASCGGPQFLWHICGEGGRAAGAGGGYLQKIRELSMPAPAQYPAGIFQRLRTRPGRGGGKAARFLAGDNAPFGRKRSPAPSGGVRRFRFLMRIFFSRANNQIPQHGAKKSVFCIFFASFLRDVPIPGFPAGGLRANKYSTNPADLPLKGRF